MKSSISSLPPVILVDDVPDDLYLLSDRLRRANVSNPILTFDRASDAMAFLNASLLGSFDPTLTAPCILITDVKMPGLDGFQLTGWVRARSEFRSVPVILLSDGSDPRETARAAKLGAAGYFPKFPRGEALAGIIARVSRTPLPRSSPESPAVSARKVDTLEFAQPALPV